MKISLEEKFGSLGQQSTAFRKLRPEDQEL